ncbi:MAG: ABC transporter permease subunit [Candidatus Binataceae bacterium]
MTSSYDPTVADFAPAGGRELANSTARPSLPYWRDAWLRLTRNRRALASFWIVVSLLLFTLLGPILWQADPAAQDLTQISLGPTFGRTAILLDDKPIEQTLIASRSFEALGMPTTEAVRLQWQPVTGAEGYRVYRHEYPPTGPLDLGVPLVSLDGNQHAYQDGLRLEAINYYYTLVAQTPESEQVPFQTIKVTVRQAITRQQARQQGLIGDRRAAGELISLPAHPLGTDYLGRDMLARLMQGARTSLFIGIFAPLIFMLIGIFYGGAAGFLGGWIDREMMRVADFVLALPFLLFMILFKVMFGLGAGESGVVPMLVALILLSWPSTARLVRAQVMQGRDLPYVAAARLMGAGAGYVIARHLLPNLLSVVLVSLTFSIPTAIFTEAFLSFIGMGVVPPTPSWGSMCNDGMRSLLWHPHELVFPALFISITVLAFNLLGDGLRDCLDVKLRSHP